MKIRAILLFLIANLLLASIIPAQVGNKWIYKVKKGPYYGMADSVFVSIQIDSIKQLSANKQLLFVSTRDTLGNYFADSVFSSSLCGFVWPYNRVWELTDSVFYGPGGYDLFFDRHYTENLNWQDGYWSHSLTITNEIYNDTLRTTELFEKVIPSNTAPWYSNKTAENLGVIKCGAGALGSSWYACYLYAVKFNGVYTPVGINDNQLDVLSSDLQLTNYPNPFNPVTTISYDINSAAKVRLSIYNAKGECVQTLINSLQTAGNHKVTFNAHGLNSGVYFYKLETGDKIIVNKMVLLK